MTTPTEIAAARLALECLKTANAHERGYLVTDISGIVALALSDPRLALPAATGERCAGWVCRFKHAVGTHRGCFCANCGKVYEKCMASRESAVEAEAGSERATTRCAAGGEVDGNEAE